MTKRNLCAKRVLSVFLAVLMGLSACLMSLTFIDRAHAAGRYTDGDFTYVINSDGEASIVSYNNKESERVDIPTTLGGYVVTGVGSSKLILGENAVKIITVPHTLKSLYAGNTLSAVNLEQIIVDENNPYFSSDDNGALFNKDKTEILCYPRGNSGTSYTVPDSVERIGSSAFAYSKNLISITIPDSVKEIGSGAFSGCENIAEFIIPESVFSIGSSAFSECKKITGINIHKNITSIGGTVFHGCTNLRTITVDEENPDYSSDPNGVLFNKEKSVLMEYPMGNTTKNYTIPYGVTNINNNAFSNCAKLESITVPDSVTKIGNFAFIGCYGAKEITLSDNLTEIGKGAFNGCILLQEVTIPENIKRIEENTFELCKKLESITIPSSVTEIRKDAFGDCESLSTVNYIGSEKQWNNIRILSNNDSLLNANIDFAYCSATFDYGYENKFFEIVAKPGEKINSPENPVREGHTFVGWSAEIPDVMPEKDVEFTALWEIESYKVTFKITEEEIYEETVLYGGEIPVPADPVREGYTFIGWNSDIATAMPANNVEYTALWSANSYNAVFEANGGLFSDGVSTKVVTAKFGEKIAVPDAPVKVGYEFAGWNPDPEIMDNVNGLVFNAQWKIKTYTVKFIFKDIIDEEQLVPYEAKINIPDMSQLTDYNFVCWVDKDGNEIQVPETMPAKDLIFFAKCEKITKSEKYDISVIYEEDKFDCNVSLSVNDETETLPEEAKAKFSLKASGKSKILAVYDICFVDENNNTIIFKDGQTVKIKIKLPEDAGADNKDDNKDGNKYVVYHMSSKDADEEFEMYADIEAVDQDGYIIFEVNHFSYFAVCVKVDPPAVKIRNNPGVATINYGDVINLTADTANMSDGMQVAWYVNGEKKAYGESFRATVENDAEITAKITDAYGNAVTDENGNEISDSQKITVKNNLWLRIISFFKNLFRINRDVVQSVFESTK